MTASISGLRSPFPLGDNLPAVYRPELTTLERESEPMQEPEPSTFVNLCAAFDEVLAPIFAVLDRLPAYLDPRTAPEDMLDWLAAWIGLSIAPDTGSVQKRNWIAVRAKFLGRRGTPAAIEALVDAAFGLDPADTDVFERLVSRSSADPDGTSEVYAPTLVVRVKTDRPEHIDVKRLESFVDGVKPAHVPHRVEVVPRR